MAIKRVPYAPDVTSIAARTAMLEQSPTKVTTTQGEYVGRERHLAIVQAHALVANRMYLSYFQAATTEVCNNIQMYTNAAPVAPLPTLIRMGIYSIDPNGNGTLAASTVNDTTVFGTVNTTYTRAFSAPFSKIKGQRYASALCIATAGTPPTVYGRLNGAGENLFANDPRLTGYLVATDLPASFLGSDVLASRPSLTSLPTP